MFMAGISDPLPHFRSKAMFTGATHLAQLSSSVGSGTSQERDPAQDLFRLELPSIEILRKIGRTVGSSVLCREGGTLRIVESDNQNTEEISLEYTWPDGEKARLSLLKF